MSNPVLQTLDLVKQQIRELEQKLFEHKRMANSLCELAQIPSAYAQVEIGDQVASFPSRGDEYYGMTMSRAIRLVLEARRNSEVGPATVAEIHQALKAGGYRFDAASDANEKKSVRICLTKNSSLFHKLPNGKYGLLKWYPRAKPPRNVPDGQSANEVHARVNIEFENDFVSEEESHTRPLIALPSKPR